jgi:hypothetical protein
MAQHDMDSAELRLDYEERRRELLCAACGEEQPASEWARNDGVCPICFEGEPEEDS